MTRVLFVPWTNTNSPEFVQKSLRWQKDALLQKDKSFKVVIYTGNKQHHISSLTDGTVYIRGHGSPAGDTVSPGAGPGADLSASDLVERLKASGLSPFFRGKIKSWNCFSGVGGTDSFAQKLCDALHTAGYESCKVYGYVGALDSFYKQRAGSFHRFSDDPILDDSNELTGWTALGRASENRHLVTPSRP